MAQTIDTARLAAALEQIVTDPKTLALVERAAAGVAKTPVSPKLAGLKTYLVAGLGVLGTVLVVVDAFVQHGGLSLTGWFAAIVALVTSTGFATLRSALNGHYGEILGTLLDMGQSIALEVASSQTPVVVAETAIAAAPAVVAGAAGAVVQAPAVVVSSAAQAVGDVVGGLTGGLASILGTAAGAAPSVPPIELHPNG